MRIGNVNRACLSFMEIPGCSSKLNPWPLHTAREEESYPPSKVDVVGDVEERQWECAEGGPPVPCSP